MSDRCLTTFRAARGVSTPLIGVQTPDPGATIIRLLSVSAKATPAIVWDACRGWRGINAPGRDAVLLALNGADPASVTLNPTGMLAEFAPKLPEASVLYCMNAHRYLSDGTASGAAFVQAIWNLRDQFKANRRTLVLLGPALVLPAELSGDVLMLDEPLPSDAELGAVVCGTLENADTPCAPEVRDAAVDALRGLATFSAEQAVAMSFDFQNTKTLDVDGLWERKRQMISATPGLAVWAGGETLEEVGGNEQIKRYIRLVLGGAEAPRVIVFVDEIEKGFAGATTGGGDSSGVAQGQLQQVLVDMQDTGASGMIFVGPPGAGKSAVAKAIGTAGRIPTIALDLTGMKASLVGESEQRLRMALKVIRAVGGGRALWVATCNKIATLPPELRRRFTMGTFFFDLPDADERAAIWSLYYQRYGLNVKRDPQPRDDGWTGAEIRQACVLAYRLKIPLAATPQFIVPVAKSAADEIDALRRQAAGKFLSASRAGVYQMPGSAPIEAASRGKRQLAKEEV